MVAECPTAMNERAIYGQRESQWLTMKGDDGGHGADACRREGMIKNAESEGTVVVRGWTGMK